MGSAEMDTAGAEQRVRVGLRLEAEGKPQQAERAYRAALRIAPDHLAALNNLGLLLMARGRSADAVPEFRRATQSDPADTVSLLNLAGALRRAGDESGALEGFMQVLAISPGSLIARFHLANLLRSQGRLEEARPHYRLMLERQPGDGRALWNLAALEGLAGDLDAAFAGFALHHRHSARWSEPDCPLWNGEALAGRRILLEADQGLGDTLMFVRFVAAVRDRGGRVILRAQTNLRDLLADLDGVGLWASSEQPAPPADVWHRLVDLPAVLGAGWREAAAPSPYLAAPTRRSTVWSERLPPIDRKRIGVVWAGNPKHSNDHNRSLPLAVLLRALAKVEGVELVSLQKGERSSEADGTRLIRADRAIDDFADTAAALTRLDLVISADTSVLHLAGAMGRPVWGLLPFAPEWRWQLGRSDSPWYPTLRLFRQPRPRDWAAVADEVAEALAGLIPRKLRPGL
jgi:Flp pilus assembly protein TadD